jgi:hypothetical protein
MWVPLRKSPAGTQLQLTLPTLPELFVARLSLKVPGPRLSVSGRTGTTVRDARQPDGSVLIDAEVSGSRLELTWREPSDQSNVVAQAVTAVNVRRVGSVVRLEADQQMDLEPGGVREVEVRLPADFPKIQVVRGTQAINPIRIADRPGWVRVPLPPSASERIDLHWELEAPFPIDGGRLVVEGLELARAGEQHGTISIENIEGYQIQHPEEHWEGVTRKNAPEPRPGAGLALTAFEFPAQPFRLPLVLDRIESRFAVKSRSFLMLSVDRADLFVDLHLDVLSGTIDRLHIDWPGQSAQGWTGSSLVEVATEAGVLAGSLEQIREGPANGLLLQFAEPRSGPLSTLLRFTRPLAPEELEFDFTLPRVPGTWSGAAEITIAGDDSVEPGLAAQDGTVVEPSPTPSAVPSRLPEVFRERPGPTFQVLSQDRAFHATLTTHPPSVETRTVISVEEIDESTARIVQRISWSVQYDRLAAVRLALPLELRNQVPSGAELEQLHVRLDDGTAAEIQTNGEGFQVVLPSPRRAIDLAVTYVLPLTQADRQGDRSLQVPIIRAPESDTGEYTSITARVRRDGALLATVSDAAWQPFPTLSGDAGWSALGQPSNVPVVIRAAAGQLPQHYTIDSAFLRTAFSEDGRAETYAEYTLAGAPSRIVLGLPAGAELRANEVRWNGLPIADRVQRVPTDPGTYVILLADQRGLAVSGRLSLRYASSAGYSLGLTGRQALELPRFSPGVWVRHTICELALPEGHQLLTSPAGFSAEFAWTRRALIWLREPTADYLARRAQYVSDAADEALSRRANVYAFGSFGPVERIAFRSMDRSLLVLIGAGLTLLLGFAFGRLPAARSVPALLTLAFAVCLAGVWWGEALTVLMQPALLGLGLAVLAATLDTATRRRRLEEYDSTVELPLADSAARSSAVGSSLAGRSTLYRPAGASDAGADP